MSSFPLCFMLSPYSVKDFNAVSLSLELKSEFSPSVQVFFIAFWLWYTLLSTDKPWKSMTQHLSGSYQKRIFE